MLYKLELPPKTRTNLTNLTWTQFELLRYATTSQLLTTIRKNMTKGAQEQLKKELMAECSHALEAKDSHCKAYAQVIAEKFFSYSLTAEANAIAHLTTFARVSSGIDKAKQTAWFTQREAEIRELLIPDDTDCITINEFYTLPKAKRKQKTKEPWGENWQEAAGEFHLYFYDNYLGSLSSLIPPEYLMAGKPEKFGRRELIEEFHRSNSELEICTMCDEAKFYTRYISQNARQPGVNSHVILDHYLPKGTYPHLCCHPYNLIPVCYSCNSPIKGEHNPLLGKDGKLQRAALPYHTINLSEQAYLKVALSGQPEEAQAYQHSTQLASIQSIEARKKPAEPSIKEAIELLQGIYKLPGRWSEEQQTIGIMHTLFRRIRHFLGDSKSSPLVADEDEEIYVKLKQLLYYLDNDDKQKDPYAFAMTWILAAFLNEKKSNSYIWQSFVLEIKTRLTDNLNRSQDRDSHVDNLLGILQASPQPLHPR